MEEGSLSKVLVYDVVQQTWSSASISSIDANDCYDRVAHAVALLVFWSFGVPKAAPGAMLRTIQEMKFFLRTAFGDSKKFAGSTGEQDSRSLSREQCCLSRLGSGEYFYSECP